MRDAEENEEPPEPADEGEGEQGRDDLRRVQEVVGFIFFAGYLGNSFNPNSMGGGGKKTTFSVFL